jgi:hypothetical protein
MYHAYPHLWGQSSGHDRWGRILPPLPKSVLSVEEQYKRRTKLSLTLHKFNTELDVSPNVEVVITRKVEVCHGALGGAQKVICKVLNGLSEMMGEEVCALIFDPLYVDLDDLLPDPSGSPFPQRC